MLDLSFNFAFEEVLIFSEEQQEQEPGIFFSDATRKDCMYPLWGPEKSIGNVCGDSVYRNRWCLKHFNLVYIKE